MNCQQCQKKLLRQATPENPIPETAVHLARCLVCRQWLERLGKIESSVQALPVAPSQAKAALIQFFRRPADAPASVPSVFVARRERERSEEPDVPAPEPVFKGSPPSQPGPNPVTLPIRHWSWPRVGLTAAAGLAAAVLLTLTGVWLGNRITEGLIRENPVVEVKPQPPGPSPAPSMALAAVILDCDMRLAQAPEPDQRVEILAELAGALHQESATLARAGGVQELTRVANLYDKVIRDGVLARAKDIPVARRRAILDPIAEQLRQAGAASDALAKNEAPAAGTAHRQMAQAAQKGQGQLSALMEEALP